MLELTGWILKPEWENQIWVPIMPSRQLASEQGNFDIYQDATLFSYHRVGDSWLRATWVGEASRTAIQQRLIHVQKQIKKEHSTTPRKQSFRQERAALLLRLNIQDMAAPEYISACRFEVTDLAGRSGWVACDRDKPEYKQACIDMETRLKVLAALPAPKPPKYEGPLSEHYVFQIKAMLEIEEVFEKPEAMSYEDWYKALLSVVGLPSKDSALSEAQKEAIAPLQTFMKPNFIDNFTSLQKDQNNHHPLSFGLIYDYLFWAILKEIPHELKINMVMRALDPALAELDVGKLKDYRPTSDHYREGFRVLRVADSPSIAKRFIL